MWMWNIHLKEEWELDDWRKSWLSDGKLRRTPDKLEMSAEGPAAFLDGWLPAEPIINADTRVLAFGSCFAARFSEWLADHGFNKGFDRDSDSSLLRNALEGPTIVAQQFRWAFGELDSQLASWYRPDRKRFEATEERRLEVRQMLESCDVLIITLGLSDEWYDVQSREPIWRAPARALHSDRFGYRVITAAECREALETIDRFRRRYLPATKIVYTVSPQRQVATFRRISPLVANTISKSILRAGVDEFFRRHAEQINEAYFYFPAYELTMELLDDPFETDNAHLRDYQAAVLLNLFARHYTTAQGDSEGASWPPSPLEEARKAIACLEKQKMELQAICDERLVVIEKLDAEIKRRDALEQGVLASRARF
jgi:hypothetical protein